MGLKNLVRTCQGHSQSGVYPGTLGMRWECILDGMPVHCKALIVQTLTHFLTPKGQCLCLLGDKHKAVKWPDYMLLDTIYLNR